MNSPIDCRQCKTIFNNGDALEYNKCFICNRNMCPECIPAPSWGSDPIPKGLLPVCYQCEIKYAKGGKEIPKDIPKEKPEETPEETPEKTPEGEGEWTKVPEKGEGKQKSTKEPVGKVCHYYEQRRCKDGRKGLECKFDHPKLCFKFMDKGDEGCPKKEECTYHHPKLCRNGKECTKENCRFLHVGRKRSPTNRDTTTVKTTASAGNQTKVTVVPQPESKDEDVQIPIGPSNIPRTKSVDANVCPNGPSKIPDKDFHGSNPDTDTSQLLKVLLEKFNVMEGKVDTLMQERHQYQQWVWTPSYQ